MLFISSPFFTGRSGWLGDFFWVGEAVHLHYFGFCFNARKGFFFGGGVVIFGSHKSRHCFVFLFWHSGSY